MKIGILDIQGSVDEHLKMLGGLDVEVVRVKIIKDLEGVDGLIMPGGESTTIGKLLKRFGLWEAIIERIKNGMAAWGTCAGAILLGNERMELIDLDVERNGYGGQLDSFETEIEFKGVGKIPAVFIRAPKFLKVGSRVEVLAKDGDEIVAAKQGKILVSSFHPELTDNKKVHQYFIEMCR